MRYVWHWLRYGRWTNCRHATRATQVVREAVPLQARDAPPRRGEMWTICTACQAVLARKKEA
jgi:hypothetical protein